MRRVFAQRSAPADDEPVRTQRRSGRRRFLKLGLWGSLIAGAGGLLAHRVGGYDLDPALAGRLRSLSMKEAAILVALTRRILASDRDDLPSVEEVEVVQFVDHFIVDLPTYEREDFANLLQLIEHIVPLLTFRLRRFTRLEGSQQDAVLEAMSTRLGTTLAGGFDVLKSLCVLAYYRDERTWLAIGYGGPLLRSL